MKNRQLGIIAVMLLLSIGKYSSIAASENIRPVNFLWIFAIGGLSAILLLEIGQLIKKKRTNPANPADSKITDTNVTVMVQDMDKSISFYEKLGLVLKNRWGEHYAMLSAKDLVLGLHPAGEKSAGSGSGNVSIGFMVDSADEAKTLLDGLQIAYTAHDDKSGIILNFTDLDGTMLYFMQPRWR